MNNNLNRRDFLKISSAGLALSVFASPPVRAAEAFKTKLHKALIVGKPTEAALAPIKEAGFEGIEAGIVTPEDAAECRKMAEKMGMRIHSVLRGWAEFNSPDKSKVDGSAAVTVNALKAAQGYGADAVLLVPCRIGGKDMPMPEPWEFKIQFDEKTGHLISVAEKDNDKYKAYIDAHNQAYDTSKVEIQKLIPVAEETKVVIAVENVWNNLFVTPELLAHFVDSFKSPWVKVYFDLGNHVKYSPTEQWLKVLRDRIVKCHVKDFKLNPDGHGGKFVDIRDGSVNWPVVRKTLDEIGYNGWMTIEGSGGLPKQEQNKRLDMIIAGL